MSEHTNERTETHACDSIIDTVKKMRAVCDTDSIEDYEALLETAFEALPSAQPEIIRCKDCKHKHIENMVWTCPFGLPGGPDFYCGYGAERRTDETD
jgi:hypothetical protein